MIDISVLIVNWNVRDLLDACLASLHNGSVTINTPDGNLATIEIIVVDSASSDDSLRMIGEKYPDVRLVAQRENIGFTRGNNLGIEQARGRYLFLLNPDTEIIGDALAQLLSYMDAHPEIGIIGPHTLNSDGTHQSSRRHFPTAMTAIFESTWLESSAPKSLLDDYYARDVADDEIAEVDWVQGSALMARREVYEQIGGLDSGFVMYSEELDWCKRAKSAGWKVIYHGQAKIIHHGGKSSEQNNAFKHIHFNTSKLRYFRKHHGFIVYILLRIVLLLMYAWQLLMESAKGLIGSRRELRKERVKVYWQVLRTGLKAHI